MTLNIHPDSLAIWVYSSSLGVKDGHPSVSLSSPFSTELFDPRDSDSIVDPSEANSPIYDVWVYHIGNDTWEEKNSLQKSYIERTVKDAYGLLDASISYTFAQSGLKLTVFGKNITDEDYHDFALDNVLTSLTWGGVPDTYGLRLTYSFD